MKQFEQFSESLFAARLKHGNPKWEEDQEFPFKNLHDMMSAINSEKKNISSLSDWFLKKNFGRLGIARVTNATARIQPGEVLEIEFSWEEMNGRPGYKKSIMLVSQ